MAIYTGTTYCSNSRNFIFGCFYVSVKKMLKKNMLKKDTKGLKCKIFVPP